jgi:DNA-binding transcriptional MerR regulator
MPLENKGLLSIKEFSQLTGIKQSTLRYFDKLGIFSPAYRGENGYRRYQPFQLIAVSVIDLLHGFGLKTSEVKAYVVRRNPNLMRDLFIEKQEEIETELKRLTVERDVALTYSSLISTGLDAKTNKITIKDLPERRITMGPENDFSLPGFEHAFSHFYRMASHYNIDLRFPVGGYFDDFDAFDSASGQPSHFFSVDPCGKDKIPAGKYMVGFTVGPYGETGNLEGRMARYLKKNGLKTIGPVYNVFLLDEVSVIEPEQYLMEALVRIR